MREPRRPVDPFWGFLGGRVAVRELIIEESNDHRDLVPTTPAQVLESALDPTSGDATSLAVRFHDPPEP
jgi:hypothetical protein